MSVVEWLSTIEAAEYVGCYPELFAEIKRKGVAFPCLDGASKAAGHHWSKQSLDAIKLLRAKGLPWLVCARVAAVGRMSPDGFIVSEQ